MMGDMPLVQSATKPHFLGGLNEVQLCKLHAISQEISVAEDELILSAREQSKSFYVLKAGHVCIEVVAPHFQVCIQVLGPGEAFGWSALLDHHDTLFQVRACEDCTVICMDGDDLNIVLGNDPELAANLLRRTLALVAGRVQATETRLAELCGVRLAKDS
jgi:CRP-like cAMP-binding protein